MSMDEAVRFIMENVRDRRDEDEHHPHYHPNDDDDDGVNPMWTVLSPEEKKN